MRAPVELTPPRLRKILFQPAGTKLPPLSSDPDVICVTGGSRVSAFKNLPKKQTASRKGEADSAQAVFRSSAWESPRRGIRRSIWRARARLDSRNQPPRRRY